MMELPRLLRFLVPLAGMLLTLLVEPLHFFGLRLRSPAARAAETLFLRNQLARYRERDVQPRRATHATRMALIWLGHWFDWRQALAVVQPATLIRWHQQGFRLFWRWLSRAARPPLPADLRTLIGYVRDTCKNRSQELC
jgi:putative transposase